MKRFAVCALAVVGLTAILWLNFFRGGPRIPKAAAIAGPVTTQALALARPGPGQTQSPGLNSQLNSTANNAVGLTQATVQPQRSDQTNAPRKRPWDSRFLDGLQSAKEGEPLRFELVNGEVGSGTIRSLERKGGEIIRIAGDLKTPEGGRFFFQKQTLPGVAGDFVGVVELPGSKRAYRIEPTGPGGAPELVERPLGDVVCLKLPLPDTNTPGASEEIPPLEPDSFPAVPIPDYQNGIIVLESLAGATPVIYLDFQGGYTPTWGGIAYDRPTTSNAQIRDVWERVSEDYMPFNLNVTTDAQVYQRAPENSRQRVIITPTSTAAPGAGGVSFVGSFNWTGDTPCWVFITSGKTCAEACSHEVGHSTGLSHDGQDASGIPHNEYYGGQGSGETGWAPIMGVGYYQNVSQWSKGQYTNANNHQDDLAIISSQNNNVSYRRDDTGETLATSRYLEIFPDSTARAEGLIERTGDTDAFQFTTGGGAISLRADPVGAGPNLALQATLYDANEALIASNNPPSVLHASISTNLAPGTYTFRVTGAGRNDPLTSGFSAYASLGYYSIIGTVANARLPDRFSLPENTANGTLVGVMLASNAVGSDPLIYTVTTGNLGNTFMVDNFGNLTVMNNALLDYEILARTNQLGVQFEMFVDIVDMVNPALSETNRRVVVAITNINEPPGLTGFNSSVLEHTRPGTAIGSVIGTDPDFYTLLSYSILSGNSNGSFNIGSHSGVVTVAGDLNAALQNVYNLSVVVSDETPPMPLMATSTVVVVVLTNNTPYQPGAISYAVYTNLNGNLISSLTNSPSFPYDPALEKEVTLFEGDSNRGTEYGAVLRGYLIPPATGNYTFWIATDDNGELWLSASTNIATAARIAYISGNGNAAGSREWTKFASQQSVAISLIRGQGYYIEGRMKQGTGADHIAVAWQCASAGITRDVIPGMFLAPSSLNFVPRPSGFTYNLHRDAFLNSRLGAVMVTDVNTTDGHTFTMAANNLITIDSVTGMVRLTNEINLQATAKTNYALLVRVTDNGSPPRSGTTTLNINVVPTNAIAAPVPNQEIWDNIGAATTVSSLASQVTFPKRPNRLRPLSSFDSGENIGDNYGSRIRAYLTPMTSGSYTFFIGSDDSSQLNFSGSTNPVTARQIAAVAGFTSYQEWTKFSSQQSTPISLIAGQRYYVETLHKEGGGGDHVEVAWTGPGLLGTNIIDGSFLTPVDLNYPPDISSTTVQAPITASNGLIITKLTATDSALDQLTYKIISGNPSNTFAINPETGTLTLNDNTLLADYFVSTFSLAVQVQDSGYGGLYPLRTAQATVTVQVIDNISPTVWTGSDTNSNWSSPLNWISPLPSQNSKLRFAGNTQQTNFNDLLTQVGAVTLNNGGFFIGGNPLLLLAGISSTGDNTWAINSTLNKPQTLTTSSGTFSISGRLNNNGYLLTLRVANNSMRVDGSIFGTGGVTKSGAGTLAISSASTYTDITTIAAGALVLTGSGSIANSSIINVQAGSVLQVDSVPGGFTVPPAQVLKGNGTIIGNTTIYGLLAPGASVGVLSFSNDLVLAGSAFLEIRKSGSSLTNDSLQVMGQLSCGGSLTVTNIGAPPAMGDTFKLFYAPSFSGSFGNVNLPRLDTGLMWDSSQLTRNGTIAVVPRSSPQILPVVSNGSNLQLQIQTAVNFNYVLETTPSLLPAVWMSLSTNLGSGGLLTLTVPADQYQFSRFFRLRVY